MDAAELPVEEIGHHHIGQHTAPAAGLDERERTMLAFEKQWWKYPGAKDQAIRELFELSSTRYYQVLNELIEKREAMQAEPLLVMRLRRLRAAKSVGRSASRIGLDT